MNLQRFEVSKTPHLTIVCDADLDIDGGREGEIAINAYGGEEDLQVQREGEHLTVTSRARCKIGCPHGTSLTLQAAHGNVRLRRVEASIAAESVHGDMVLKDVGPTTITNAMGDLRVRPVNGDLRLQQVAGDLSARGVGGLLSCDRVAGDLSAYGLKGGLRATVGGDASLKTDFTPGKEYVLTTGGDATVRFPTDASANIQVTASSDIKHRVEWSEVTEGPGTLSGRLGEGEASVAITAGGGVTLQSRSDASAFVVGFALEDTEFDLELETMAEEIERNIEAQMGRLHAQLEAKLSSIDHEAVRRRVERSAEKARRKAERAAERARLKAERAQRRWERMGARQPVRPTPPRGPAEPVGETERLAVLRLVQEGKISAEEAARLLEAMEG
jgi:hypothetical protein